MSDKHKPGIGYEHPYSHHIQFGSIIIFFIIWILDTFIIEFAISIRNIVPFVVRIGLFISTAIVSYFLINSSHKKIFSSSEQKSQLINDGVYSYIRHPMYISIIVLLFAFTLLSFSLLSLLPLFVAIFFFNRMMTYEEVELLNILGNEYKNYMNQVPRWIPRLKFT